MVMSESTNSRRHLYKATYSPIRINPDNDYDRRLQTRTFRALEKLNYVRALDVKPAEYDRVRRALAAQLQDNNGIEQALARTLEQIGRVLNRPSPASFRENVAAVAELDMDSLLAFGEALVGEREKLVDEVESSLRAVQSEYATAQIRPVSSQPLLQDSALENPLNSEMLTFPDQSDGGSEMPFAAAAMDAVEIQSSFLPLQAMVSLADAVTWALGARPELARPIRDYVETMAPPQLLMNDKTPVTQVADVVGYAREKFEIAHELTEVFRQRMTVEPIGRLYLERVEMSPSGTERGELLYSVPLAPRETVNITHVEWATRSEEFEKIIQDYMENYSEQGVAEKNDEAMSAESQSRHSNALNFGASVSGSYMGVTVSTSFGYANSSDEQQSRKDSRNHTQEVTRKAAARTRKEHKVTFKVASAAGTEDRSVRTITNPSKTDAMRVDYYRIMRKWRNDLFRYGVRMTYDIVIPDPGVSLRDKLLEIEKLEMLLQQPFKFDLPLTNVTRTEWQKLATQHGAVVEPPPPESMQLSQSKIFNSDGNRGFQIFEFQVDDVTYFSSGSVVTGDILEVGGQAVVWVRGGTSSITTDGPGKRFIAKSTGNIAISNGKAQVDFAFQGIGWATVQVTLGLKLRQAVFDRWQAQAWGAMRQAAEETYYQNIQRLRDRRAELVAEIERMDSLTLRKMEREEIIKGVVRWLFGPDFYFVPPDVQAVFDKLPGEYLPSSTPVSDWQRVLEYGEFVKFLNQAIEWENLIYFLYPYYWGSTKKWAEKRFLEHPDPLHRDFLRAGSARVVLTIRPGFEEAFTQLVELGSFGKLPGNHPYVTIAQEIQFRAKTNYPGIPPANAEKQARPQLYPEQRRAWDQMQQLIALLDEYHRKNGYYPAALTDLSTLLPFTFKVGLQSITLTAVPSKDLWGNDYYYKSPGLTGEYDLVCLGSDGQPGSTNDDPLSDDISSAAEGSMIATWFDYTPTGAMDIQILRVVADE
jgi:hypothetical protein